MKLIPVLVVVSSLACAPCPPVACVGTLTVTFVNASGAPLTPAQVTVGGTEFTCMSAGTTCSGNTLTLTNVTDGVSITIAQATTGERFAGTNTPTWKATGEAAGTCCSGTRSSAVTLTLAP